MSKTDLTSGSGSHSILRSRGGLFATIAYQSFRHPVAVVVAGVILSAAALHFARGVELDSDISRMLPPEASSVRNLEQLQESFGGTGYVTILLSGESPAHLIRFAERLAPQLRRLDGVRYVQVRRPVKFFKDRMAYYLAVADLQEIHRRVQIRMKWEKLRANPLYVDLEDQKPPAIEIKDVLDRHRARNNQQRYNLTDNEFFSDRGGRRLLIQVKPTTRSTDLQFSRSLVERIRKTTREAASAAPFRIHAAISGRHTKRVEQQSSINADLRTSGLVAVVLLLLFLTFHLGSLRSTVLVMIPLLTGVLWTFGWAGGIVGSLNLLSAFVGVILLGIGVDHGLHLIGRFHDARRAGIPAKEAIRESFAKAGRGVLIAGATTAASFAALATSEFRGFREFGVIAAGGLLMQVAAYLFLLPALVALDDRIGYRRWRRTNYRLLPAVYRRIHSWAPAVLWIGLLAALALGVGLTKIRFQYDFEALNPRNLPSSRTDREVNKLLGHSQTPLVVLAPDDTAAHGIAREIERRERLRAVGVDFVLTINDFIPAKQPTKYRILKQISIALQDADPEDMSARDRKRLAELKRISGTPPFAVADLPISVRRMFHPDKRGASAVLVFPSIALSDGARVRKLASALRDLPVPNRRNTVTAAGEAMLLADILDRIFATAPFIMGLAAALVIGVITILSGSLRTLFIVLAAPTATIVVTLGLMPVLGLQFNYLNVVILPVLFGMGVDGGIHLALHRHKPWFFQVGMAAISRSVAGSILTTMIGLGSLMLTHHPGLRSLAALALLGNAINLVVCLILVPALLALLDTFRKQLGPRPRTPGTTNGGKATDDAVGIISSRIVSLVATVGGAGYSKVAPGTLGALVALPAAWILAQLQWAPRVAALVTMTVCFTWFVKLYMRGRLRRDPQEVVIDEFIGFLIAAAFVEWHWPWVAAAFGLFRLFDIWKPWPIRAVDERLPGALGIVGDDVLAGLAAGALLMAAHFALTGAPF